MTIAILSGKVRDISGDILDDQGRLRILPAEQYARYSKEERIAACVRNGLYLLPTEELVEWLRNAIGNRKAIEVAAGNGALGRALGIPRTDLYQMTIPAVMMAYRFMQQPVTNYGKDVQKMEAMEAIKQFSPEVVIAAWLTHRYRASKQDEGGNMYAPEPDQIRKNATFMLIGNTSVHETQLKRAPTPTVFFRPNWLFSRAFGGDDFIAAWEKT